MNLFINHFAFTEPKDGISSSDVVDTLSNLGNLFIALKKINVEISIHQSLSQTIFVGKPIREYIKSLPDINIRMAIIGLVSKVKPICSDIDTPYEDNENIVLGNCKEVEEELDILNTFMGCAIYYNEPILTINNLCNKEQFLRNTINIICDENISYTLNNYHLIPYEDAISQLQGYQENNKLDEYNSIDNWNDYKEFVNKNFQYAKITIHCMKGIERRYSYDNSYSNTFRKKVKRFNDLIKEKGGKPKEMNFKPLGLGRPESNSNRESLKKSHKGIKDFENNIVELDWHEYILDDCRVYFEKKDDYICFVHYEKKIT